jgi:hypothetical protein
LSCAVLGQQRSEYTLAQFRSRHQRPDEANSTTRNHIADF